MRKPNSLLVVSLASLLACAACSGAGGTLPEGNGPIDGDGQLDGTPESGGSRSGGGMASAPEAAGASAGAPAPPGGGGGGGGGGNGQVAAGILTAGAWDDNANFDRFLRYRAGVIASGQHTAGLLPIDEAAHRAAHAAPRGGAKQTLDVSLMIDTTGSMGDELRYLQTEFSALATRISQTYPGAQQRWSLVLYKDTTDEYIVRWFNFRSDTAEFRAHLAAQSASGGGDFPEAPDSALAVANRLTWRTGADTARLLFWVADAPHHDAKAEAMAAAIKDARDKGIHVYPVASSGVDELTELSMRSAAQLTGGRYLFLTDDSGVGGAHKEASVPCYFVTKLDKAILRMVDIEMTGAYREPAAADVVRTGGNPTDGACQLEGPPQAY